MAKQVELNYYRFMDIDQGAYIVEGEGVLDVFSDYIKAIDYCNSRGYSITDHCN